MKAIRAIISQIEKMGKARKFFTSKVLSMKESSKTVFSMALESSTSILATILLVSSRKGCAMAKEPLNFPMGMNMKVNGKRTIRLAKAL